MNTLRMVYLFIILFIFTPPTWSNNVFTVAYSYNFPPYSFEVDGEMRGILVDVIDHALRERMNIPVVHKGYPWVRAQEQVKLGKADAFITNPTSERKGYTRISEESIIQPERKVFSRADHPKLAEMRTIQSFEQMVGFTVGVAIGNGFYKKMVVNKGIPINTDYAPHFKQVLQKVASGRNDLTFAPTESTHYYLKSLGLQDQVIELSETRLHQSNYALCIGQQSPFVSILPQFNTVIRKMREDGTLQAIVQKYH
ncbi:MAG: transporter substrate-binding domain-containing protein [Sedimenticola sp.]